MRNLKKISIMIISLTAILLLIGGAVNAAGLTLKTITDKKELSVGEEVTVTVDWEKGMQMADFTLNYDRDKLEFVSSSLGEDYTTNDKENGKVKVIWISLLEKDMSKATFTFKVKTEGEAKFSVKVDDGFADDNMVVPSSYDVTTYGVATVTLKSTGGGTQQPTTTPTPEATQKPVTPTTQTSQTSTVKPVPTATTKAPTVLPKAGDGLNILIVIPILLTITVLAYIQIRKYKEI